MVGLYYFVSSSSFLFFLHVLEKTQTAVSFLAQFLLCGKIVPNFLTMQKFKMMNECPREVNLIINYSN